MGCGCGKKSGVLPLVNHAASAASTASRVAVYEVMKDGEAVLTTTSPTAARQEAKRLNGSIRVTSRAATEEEQTAVSAATA